MGKKLHFLPYCNKVRTLLLVLVLLGFGLRMGFVLHVGERALWPDEKRYIRIARNICTYGRFGNPGKPEFSTPVLPFLLSLSFRTFGPSIFVYRVFQGLLGSILILIVFYLGKELFDIGTGIIASVVTALYPYFVYLDGLILPQSLFTFVLATSMLVLAIALRKGQLRYFILSGVSFGLCALIVVPVVAFFPFVGIYMLLRRKIGWTKKVTQLSLMAMFSMMVMGSWILRLYIVHNRFIPILPRSTKALVLGNNRFATSDHAKNPYDKGLYARILGQEKFAVYKNLATQQEKDAYLKEHIFNSIISDPVRYLKLYLGKFAFMFSPIPSAYTKSNLSISCIIVSLSSYGPILLLSFFGVFLSSKNWKKLVPLYTLLFSVPGLYSVLFTTQRYRIPLDVYLILFASNTISLILAKLGNRLKPHVRTIRT